MYLNKSQWKGKITSKTIQRYSMCYYTAYHETTSLTNLQSFLIISIGEKLACFNFFLHKFNFEANHSLTISIFHMCVCFQEIETVLFAICIYYLKFSTCLSLESYGWQRELNLLLSKACSDTICPFESQHSFDRSLRFTNWSASLDF